MTRPLSLGGLGVPNLQLMSWALQAKWLWLEKTDPTRPWLGLSIPVQQQVRQFFNASVISVVGNGTNTFFWSDRWLNGQRIQDFAPEVVNMVSSKPFSSRTVAQALHNGQWVRDITNPLSLIGLHQYLQLWDALSGVVLNQEEDRHVWVHSSSGVFSSKSCYSALFMGAITFQPWKWVWKSWAPPKCKFFVWLAIRNKCWTADRLQRKGLPHPVVCPLCDQEQETILHLLCSCSFARQFWHIIFSALRMGHLTPTREAGSFVDWWGKVHRRVPKHIRKGFHSLIILGAWCLWLHRNKAVFDGVNPSLSTIQRLFLDEVECWCMAGAKQLESLGLLAAFARGARAFPSA